MKEREDEECIFALDAAGSYTREERGSEGERRRFQGSEGTTAHELRRKRNSSRISQLPKDSDSKKKRVQKGKDWREGKEEQLQQGKEAENFKM